jgi:hypothetical protein
MAAAPARRRAAPARPLLLLLACIATALLPRAAQAQAQAQEQAANAAPIVKPDYTMYKKKCARPERLQKRGFP